MSKLKKQQHNLQKQTYKLNCKHTHAHTLLSSLSPNNNNCHLSPVKASYLLYKLDRQHEKTKTWRGND